MKGGEKMKKRQSFWIIGNMLLALVMMVVIFLNKDSVNSSSSATCMVAWCLFGGCFVYFLHELDRYVTLRFKMKTRNMQDLVKNEDEDEDMKE